MTNFDSLEVMLKNQWELQRDLGYDFAKMNPEERIEFMKNMYIAAIQELGEVLNETSWKPWTTGVRLNTHALIGELNDVFQFIMNMWFAAMPTATIEDIAGTMLVIHTSKIAVNRKRARVGYDGVSGKCPECRRALDDQHVTCTPDLGYCQQNDRLIP